MDGKERNEHEALCPHCGAEAQWSFLSSKKSRIEVRCPDCGRYEIDREEFDQAAIDSAEIKGSTE
jgi:predicted RNA-binding Zn-ribbon protein involved in translation (DUF1610 family)